MDAPIEKIPYYTVIEIAELKHVDPSTVRDWIKKGYLTGEKINPQARNSPLRIPKTINNLDFLGLRIPAVEGENS